MKRSLKIVAADDERDMRCFYDRILTNLGHQVIGLAATGEELIERCNLSPDLIITDIRMPDMDGIEAARQATARQPAPVILVSAFHDDDLIRRAEEDHVMAYLIKPVDEADLETAISVAISRFEQFQAVQQEASDLRQALQDRRLIERAKGILMKRANLSEADAFRRLQKLSWDKNQKLAEVAASITTADQAMEPALAPPKR